ncbi:MAG: ligase-associated DNA damage response DEXH box helicase, partial [Phycisphaerae bacterium]|nr:ligase-associated DNA damage response DEXH box helicase [Phycisphaerae bacterium]
MNGWDRVQQWFKAKGQSPFEFQERTWRAYLAGDSGLITVPTGGGKTLAAALGPMIEALDANLPKRAVARRARRNSSSPLTMLWITPLRALAADTAQALTNVVAELHLPWTVELRTSDTSSHLRRKQKDRLPTVLVTTPESLSLLISYPDIAGRVEHLRCLVVDEWHELMGTKRGVQAELGLARLRAFRPDLRLWGLSATIANVDEAMETLLGARRGRLSDHAARMKISAPDHKQIEVKTLIPDQIERFPWAGHLGARMAEPVAQAIESAGTTLVFTNTRSQTELWFRALLQRRPDWLDKLAVHHGSIDRGVRSRIEQMLRTGQLKAVVCTSSLDLGVDFAPVDQVIQIGSPKGIARAMQRAGRSGHQPGAVSQIIFVPTQAFELLEFSATRLAVDRRALEPRDPVTLSLDVLAQHLVTVGAGGGFDADEMLAEIRTTHAFAAITDEQWGWVLDFIQRGGPSLVAYPQYARVRPDESGRWKIVSDRLARMHRMSIGTIASDSSVLIKMTSGRTLGSVEESFAAKLRPGDVFSFSGRTLEFVRLHEMTAQVRKAKSKSGSVPRWMGSRLPMSVSLAATVRERLAETADGIYADIEMETLRPILELQRRWSVIPRQSQVLIEYVKTRDGHHHFVFPFQGRLAHEGLSALMTFRFARRHSAPITATFNDYGLELLSTERLATTADEWLDVLTADRLLEDVLYCVNSGELGRRHFREIARIAGLLVPMRPGVQRSTRQLQASSELFYDVFSEFDPDNLL